MNNLNNPFAISIEIVRALQDHLPIVALESTVITHGLPRPNNLTLAEEMERAVRSEGAIPATIALLEEKIRVGLSPAELERLANARDALKVSLRDFATVLLSRGIGGTTVAGTLFVAQKTGIDVLATGGIGGVHHEHQGHHERHEHTFDVSTDLQALANTPMIVVCAGAKSILNLPATLEYLETIGVPVVGFQTDKFPEFFSIGKRLPVSVSLDSPEQVVKFAQYHWNVGMHSAVLVCQQVPSGAELPHGEAEHAEHRAQQEAEEKGITGQRLTPFLLNRVNELTEGRSMRANLALLLNNARLGAQLARALIAYRREKRML